MSGRVFRYGGDFAEMQITRAQGCHIFDQNGRPILDFTSGQMSAILGHSHAEIAEVVRDQSANLDHLHSSFLSDPVVAFAESLTAMLPESLDRVLPLSTGGEANEAALRVAKTYTGGFEVVAFDRSWHGVTGGHLFGRPARLRAALARDFDPAYAARLSLPLQQRWHL